MKSSWLFFAFLFCLIAATQFVAQTPAVAKAPSALEQTAIANEKTLIEAKRKDDGAFFKRTLSSDFSLVGVDGKLLEGQEAVDNLGDTGLLELTPYDIKVVALGNDGAIVTYDAIVREAPEEDQGPPPRYQHFSSVWVKHGDQWKLKFHQATAAHWGDW
ncbi:MAG: nuclear transport factor 2 family protein [Candidatus Sulfotelmatobacter sp.]